MALLATIGYEGANLEDFLATLAVANVGILVDVRAIPLSRRKGFSKSALSRSVEKAGFSYVHMPKLGDPKEGRDAARAGEYAKFIQIYSEHLRQPESQAELAAVAALTSKSFICLMCYERAPNHCHRLIVANSITDIFGGTIQHLGVREGIGQDGGAHTKMSRVDSRQGAAASWQ